MKHSEGFFKGFDNLTLYYQSWHPDDQGPDDQGQPAIALVHGLGGHGGLFYPAVEYLVAHHYEVYALDLRGHGHSPGQRGYINAWKEFREDVGAFLRHIREQRSQCAYFLWGHSLGGTIALDYVLRSPNDVTGLILTAPALAKVCISPAKLAIGNLMSGVWPRFSLPLGIREELCTRDPEVCEAYLHDPLRHRTGSARLATEFFATVDWIYHHTADLRVPLLLMHGGADEVTSPESSRLFFEQVTFPDKEHHEYPNNCHDLYADLNSHEVFADLNNWLDRHLKERTACQPRTLCSLNY